MARRYTFNNIEIDVEGFRLLKEGRQLPVEPKALNLLIFLLDHRGKLLERRAIIDAVWGGAFVSDHVLNRAVGQLRKLLDDDSKQPRYIETVPTLGYRFIADVRVNETSDSPPDAKPVAEPPAESSTPESGSEAAFHPSAAAKVPAGWRRIIASSVIFVVAAACAAGFWALKKSGAGEAPIRSLAVLPLENLSGDTSQEYVADGMTAQLITALAQIRALRVISQTTAMQYKNAHKALPQIARELNVDAVIEGS
jgi:DNA-binding winged helix-turn-helix (wHTH) protein